MFVKSKVHKAVAVSPQRLIQQQPARACPPAYQQLTEGLCVALLCLFAGCNGAPSSIEPPAYNPDQTGAKAIEMFDQNGDGVISGNELKDCPGLAASIRFYDKDGDGGVNADEVAARLRYYIDSKVGVSGCMLKVTLNGQPLAGGAITLEPEPFLESVVPEASAGIGKTGLSSPSASDDVLPDDLKSGMRFGVYRVKVTHPDYTIPARYNVETTLGVEVGPDFDFYNPPTIALKTK